jgi:hypothetical protein
MDERAMLRWVEDVLAPYVALAPPGIFPVILLDPYRCHIMVLGDDWGKQTQNGQINMQFPPYLGLPESRY